MTLKREIDMEKTITWVPGYESIYQISSDGKVWNVKSGATLRGNVNSHGYVVVSLTKDGVKKDCKLHRLLALAFLPNPNDFDCVNHKDGDKLNNSLDNLEWCTKGYNNRHAREQLGIDFSAKPVCQTTMSGDFVALWANLSQAAKSVGVTSACVSRCCEGHANSAGGYRWEFAAKAFSDFVAAQKKESIRRKIAELSAELERL